MDLPHPFAAILLAGGRSRRTGGTDKTAATHHGRKLIELAAESTAGSLRTVIVGPPRPHDLPSGTVRVQEDPPFGGPAAGLLAGAQALGDLTGPDVAVVVLACDLVRPATALNALTSDTAIREWTRRRSDGLIAIDDDGRRQPLLAVYRLESLLRLAGDTTDLANRSLRSLLRPLHLTEIPVPSAFCTDIDTADDAREHDVILPRTTDLMTGELR